MSDLQSEIRDLQSDPKYADVRIKSNQKVWHLHCNIVCTRSGVLAEKYDEMMLEDTAKAALQGIRFNRLIPTIDLSHLKIPKRVLEQVWHFLYNDTIVYPRPGQQQEPEDVGVQFPIDCQHRIAHTDPKTAGYRLGFDAAIYLAAKQLDIEALMKLCVKSLELNGTEASQAYKNSFWSRDVFRGLSRSLLSVRNGGRNKDGELIAVLALIARYWLRGMMELQMFVACLEDFPHFAVHVLRKVAKGGRHRFDWGRIVLSWADLLSMLTE